jgi:hypothetical protein
MLDERKQTVLKGAGAGSNIDGRNQGRETMAKNQNAKKKGSAVLVPGEVIRGVKLTGMVYFGDQETRRAGRSRSFTEAKATGVLAAEGKLTIDYKMGSEAGTLEATGETGTWKEGDYSGSLKLRHLTDGKKHVFVGTWKDTGPEAPAIFDLDEV